MNGRLAVELFKSFHNIYIYYYLLFLVPDMLCSQHRRRLVKYLMLVLATEEEHSLSHRHRIFRSLRTQDVPQESRRNHRRNVLLCLGCILLFLLFDSPMPRNQQTSPNDVILQGFARSSFSVLLRSHHSDPHLPILFESFKSYHTEFSVYCHPVSLTKNHTQIKNILPLGK